MKKYYEAPEAELVKFLTDCITTMSDPWFDDGTGDDNTTKDDEL